MVLNSETGRNSKPNAPYQGRKERPTIERIRRLSIELVRDEELGERDAPTVTFWTTSRPREAMPVAMAEHKFTSSTNTRADDEPLAMCAKGSRQMLELFGDITLTDSHEPREVAARCRAFEKDRTDTLSHSRLSSISHAQWSRAHRWQD